MYENLIRVPLLMRYPGGIPAGQVIDEQVELIDVMPTVLNLMKIPWDGSGAQGRDLADRIDGRGTPLPGGQRAAFSETNRLADRKTIRDGNWKYIHDYQFERGELYHLDADPGELDDLMTDHPEKAAAMFEKLERWRLEQISRGSEPRDLDPELEEKLRSLGYLP